MDTTKKKTKEQCCHLNCKSKATHSIHYSDNVEDYSHFCGKHIHQYLPNNYSVTVSPVPQSQQ